MTTVLALITIGVSLFILVLSYRLLVCNARLTVRMNVFDAVVAFVMTAVLVLVAELSAIFVRIMERGI